MLYEFRSRATGSVTMTGKTGDQILQIIGKTPGPTGIITVAQIPAAIDALKQAAAREQKPVEEIEQDEATGDGMHEPPVSLRQRVVPLIEMLQQAHEADADITWGV
ncbi:MAG: DUF1840 domain-containing protein [Lautropia sp.]|nr:DUF1840 domain-containing protein [Lautropia sp.]